MKNWKENFFIRLMIVLLLSYPIRAADKPDVASEIMAGMNQNDWPRVLRALPAGAKAQDEVEETIFGQAIQKAVWDFTKPGMSNVVVELLRRGLSLDDTNQDNSVLWSVLYSSKGEPLAMWLMEQGAGKKLSTEGRTRLFSEALKSGYSNVVARFVAMGLSVNSDLGNGTTPLMCLAASDRWRAYREKEMAELARFLVAKGADPFARGANGKTAEDAALAAGHPEIALVLNPILQGTPSFKEAARHAAQNRLGAAIGQRMLELMNSQAFPPDGVDKAAMVRSALADGANPNELDIVADMPALETSPFGAALGMGGSDYFWQPMPSDPVLVQELIRGGANIRDPLPNNGPPPLVVAESKPIIFKLLLDAGADPKRSFRLRFAVPGASGMQAQFEEMSVLHHVAAYGAPENLKLLLEKNLVLEEKDVDGFTPLLRATEAGNDSNVSLLLKARAKTAITSRAGESFEELAGKSMLVGVLRELGMTNRFQQLLREFPAQSTSRLVGRWATKESGTNVVLTLRADGSGSLRHPYWNYNKGIAWKMVGDSVECRSFGRIPRHMMFLPPQQVDAKFTYNAAKDVLVYQGPTRIGELLIFSELIRVP